jgi:PDDEXK-like uncharacterized protein DUF3799
MTPLLHADGTVHVSDLKRMALSPAHYRAGLVAERTTTPAMRLGTLVDTYLLTTKRVFAAGKTRADAAFKGLQADHPRDDVYTATENDRACAIVEAVSRDPLAIEYLGIDDLARRTQVPLKWDLQGVPMSTRGLDVLTRGKLGDLKVTNSTHPARFAHHARGMFWHAQLAAYDEACKQNGIAIPNGVFLIGVESSEPYPVTVLRMTESALEAGNKLLSMWIEQYKACANDDVWPGYVQSPIDLDVETFDTDDLVFPGEGDEAA